MDEVINFEDLTPEEVTQLTGGNLQMAEFYSSSPAGNVPATS